MRTVMVTLTIVWCYLLGANHYIDNIILNLVCCYPYYGASITLTISSITFDTIPY